MTPELLIATGIDPALKELKQFDSREARVFMLAIAFQETALKRRRQVVGGAEIGPAAGFWQFEAGGGAKGVLNHPASRRTMEAMCSAFNVESDPTALWIAIRWNDVLAAIAARLLIWTHPTALPKTAAEGWQQYLALWRPGKPHPETWDANWHRSETMF